MYADRCKTNVFIINHLHLISNFETIKFETTLELKMIFFRCNILCRFRHCMINIIFTTLFLKFRENLLSFV